MKIQSKQRPLIAGGPESAYRPAAPVGACTGRYDCSLARPVEHPHASARTTGRGSPAAVRLEASRGFVLMMSQWEQRIAHINRHYPIPFLFPPLRLQWLNFHPSGRATLKTGLRLARGQFESSTLGSCFQLSQCRPELPLVTSEFRFWTR